MSWMTDDGGHEGYVVPLFADGMAGSGYTGKKVLVGYRADGSFIGGAEESRPDSAVVAWQVRCVCGWRGKRWGRVASEAEADAAQQRAYSPDAFAPEDVDDFAHAEWRTHIAPFVVVQAVELAAAEVADAQAHLTDAVLRARGQGASWEAIGTAAGMTRQSAHERWAKLEKSR